MFDLLYPLSLGCFTPKPYVENIANEKNRMFEFSATIFSVASEFRIILLNSKISNLQEVRPPAE